MGYQDPPDPLHPLLRKYDPDNGTFAHGHSSSQISLQEQSLHIFDWRGRPPASAQKNSIGGRRTLYFTLGNICLWYTAYFGLFFNMVLFFKNVLGKGSGEAANDTNNWFGSMFLSSLLGALVAESFLGRLYTCAAFQTMTLLGILKLCIPLKHCVPDGEAQPFINVWKSKAMATMTLATSLLVSGDTSGGAQVFFFISLYFVSMGCGAFQSALQSLGADQFDDEGEKATFFTFYLVLNHLGTAIGDTVIVYATTAKGWVFGFSMCTIVGLVGLVLFFCGFRLFRQYKHKGNPYRRALQVIVAAARKWHLKVPTDSSLLYEEPPDAERRHRLRLKHTNNLRCLDKAAILVTPDSSIKRDHWKLSTVTEVEEMKTVLRLLPVWASSIFFNTVYSQAGTLFVEEGETMDTSLFFTKSFSMEPATMNMFCILVVVLSPRFYNAVIVPLARRITGLPRGLSPLHRVGFGYVLCIVAVSLAAMVERIRLQHAHAGLAAPSIFWQVPEFVLLGAAQFLAGIGQIEFFYTYSPLSLRSLGSSFYLTCVALGNYVSSLLVSVVMFATSRGGGEGWIASTDLNEGHLDYFFWLLAGLAVLNLLFFVTSARSFTATAGTST